MAKTRIEWTDATWSPVTGCAPISEGCQNCYAKRMANRLRGRCGYPKENPFKVTLHPERLDEPLKWRKPRKVFVCSMSDLFHPDVPFEYIAKVWQTMNNAEQHTFLVLTKRPKRMAEFLSLLAWYTHDREVEPAEAVLGTGGKYTLPNVWLGVTVENQAYADERIPILLQIPAAVRFVSCEPLLSAIDLTKWLGGINWCIVGGETGPGARPMHPDWVRSLRDQCQAAGVPFFFKQWGEYGLNWLNDDNGKVEGSEWMDRIGKKRAGRLLDGRTWDEMPRRGQK